MKANPSNNTNSTVNNKGPTIAAVVKSSISNHTTTTSSVSTVSQSITTQTSTTTVGNFATVAASNIHNKHTRKSFFKIIIKAQFIN